MRAAMRRDLEMRVTGMVDDAQRNAPRIAAIASEAEAKAWAGARSLGEYQEKMIAKVSNHGTALRAATSRTQITSPGATLPHAPHALLVYVSILADGQDDATAVRRVRLPRRGASRRHGRHGGALAARRRHGGYRGALAPRWRGSAPLGSAPARARGGGRGDARAAAARVARVGVCMG